MADDTFLQRELRRRMKLAGLSMRGLSLKADLNESAVKAILSGKSQNPRSDTLSAIARELDCTINDLLGAGNGAPTRLDSRQRSHRLSLADQDRIVDAVKIALSGSIDPRKKGAR